MGDIIASVASGLVEPFLSDAIKNKAAEIKNKKFSDPRLVSSIQATLLERFGNESFYNNFTEYLQRHNTIENVLDMFNAANTIKDSDSFVDENMKLFIENYGCQYSEKSALKNAFFSIYNLAYNEKVILNPYSDLGKLQQDIHRIENKQIINSNIQTDLLETILYNQNQILAKMGNISVTTTDDISSSSEKINEFLEQVKNVGNQNNPTKDDEDTIAKYKDILSDVAIKLRGENQSQIDKVICSIECRIALCYSNLGNKEEALRHLSFVQEEIAKNSKLYHLVKAVIIVNHCLEDEYSDAKTNIEIALSLDPNYHRAFFVKQYLLALRKEKSDVEIIKEMDEKFKVVLDRGEDNNLIADYYVFRAFIYKEYDKQYKAIENHNLAKQYGYDPVVVSYNIALSYYLEGVKNVPKGVRTFGSDIKHYELIKVVEILKPFLKNENQLIRHSFLKSKMIELYVSSCSLIGIKHRLEPINNYIKTSGLSYESVRNIILGSEEIITQENIDILDEDDKMFARVFNCLHSNDFDGIKSIFVNMDQSAFLKLPQGLLYMLLQTCVISKDTKSYWKYRSLIAEHTNNELIECLDGYSYELEGKIEDAKTIFDKHAFVSKDYHILSNILSFYSRNGLNNEHEKLLIHILELRANKSIYIDEPEQFYGQAISFLLKVKSYNAKKFIDTLNSEVLPIETIYKIKWNYFSAIGDVLNMYECINIIYDDTPNFENGCNKVICLIKLMKYDDALSVALSMFNSLSEDKEKEKAKMMHIISDIYLFMNDNDNSFEWAKKAHTLMLQNPYDDSHQFYMNRATRTGHTEALSDTIKYKQTHPVVIGKWMKEFKISDDNPLESLTKAIEEMSGESHDEYEKREQEIASIYRSNLVSNSLLLKHYHQSLSNMFSFASKHKLSISEGNIKGIEEEMALVNEDIFVDALTLIIMNQHKCIEILNDIKCVHICYSTVARLQNYVVGLDAPYVINVLDWIYRSNNIVFEQDGYSFDSINSEVFSEEFLICCNAAALKDTPILMVEPVVKIFQRNKLEIIPLNLKTVSLPSFCNKIMSKEKLESALYDLLYDCRFISFRADTIILQIEKNSYRIDNTLLDRFLICDTTCDMISFVNVYCEAIRKLLSINEIAAKEFTLLILKDGIRIWKRGLYYRYLLEKNPNDIECQNKAESIQKYLINLTFAIKKIYPDAPSEIEDENNSVIRIIYQDMIHSYFEELTLKSYLPKSNFINLDFS